MTVYDELRIELYESMPKKRALGLSLGACSSRESHEHLIEIYENEHYLEHREKAVIHSILKRKFL